MYEVVRPSSQELCAVTVLEFNSGGEGFKSGWLGIRIRRRGGVRERANKKAG